MKQEINHKSKQRNYKNTWRLNNSLLNNEGAPKKTGRKF